MSFTSLYRDFDAETRPRDEARVRIGRLVVFGKEVAFWGYLNICKRRFHFSGNPNRGIFGFGRRSLR